MLLVAIVTGASATVETVTLSGTTSKGAKADVLTPSIATSSATITTGACASTCANSGYHISNGDGKYLVYGGTNYYIGQTYKDTSAKSWQEAGLTNQYGTFTIPTGYTYTITKVSHAMGCVSSDFTASILVKDATSAQKYTSGNIALSKVSDKSTITLTNIDLATENQVVLAAGTYTLNVNLTTTSNSTGKYCGIAQIILTGNLEAAGIDTHSPEITTDLDDNYEAYMGDETVLSIEASHYTGFQWYEASSATVDPTSDEPIEGANNYAYVFTPDAAGTKYYYCVVTNENATGTKTATSSVTSVSITAKTPEFALSASSIATSENAQIQVSGKSDLDGLSMVGLSYDDAVISINAYGQITPVAPGTSTITFTTEAGGNYAAGSANLSITVTGPVIASSNPSSWENANSRTWSVSKITFSGQGEGGNNGLYFKTGTSNTISYTSGNYFSLKAGNIMYLEVPSATSTGTVTIVSQQTNDRYLTVTNAAGVQQVKMSQSGSTVLFDANSIEEIGGKYYIKLTHGDGECKIVPSNFATVKLAIATVTLNASGFATYSSASDFEFVGADAYGLTLTTEALTSTKVTSGKVAAGQGVLFKGEPSATVAIIETTGATEISNNSLLGTTAASGSTVSPDYTSNKYYALKGGTFKYYTGATFAANKAVFCVDKSTNLPNEFAISFDDATAIKGIAETEADAAPVKVVKNGQLYIGNYNVAGQLVK